MSGVAVAIGAAAVIGYVSQTNSANSAASAQRDAAESSNQLQQNMYDQNRRDNEPWRTAGAGALTQLQDPNFGKNLEMDPGYQFRLSEGNKAINAAAASRGSSMSGGAMKSLTRYGQDYASGEYNNAYNRQYSRLSSLAGIGQNANSQNAAGATGYANAVSSNNMGAANAQSAGAIAQGNATSNLANGGANSWMQYQMMNRMFPKAGA